MAGRRALVTGAASGIGAACARRLARAGAQVTVLDIDASGAEQVAREIGGAALILDLSLPGPVPVLDVDILVNNAGIQHLSPVEDFPAEAFEHIIKLMLVAPFELIKAVLPGMYARGWGRIVNISSIHGRQASPFKAAYVAAKHGLEGLSKVTALEGGAKGVTSNCIAPGYVRTPLVDRQVAAQAELHGIPADEVIAQIMLSGAAIKRFVEPDEVAELAAYLCTPAAALISGSSLVIDGGTTAG
ncbi:MAG TPA: SDR family oxidoreductase [Mycobacteriales bacterium]|nr:SDR family oxidoreductase [Mycobacteriales bacterium]